MARRGSKGKRRAVREEDDEEISEDEAFTEVDYELYGDIGGSGRRSRRRGSESDYDDEEEEEDDGEDDEDGETINLSDLLDAPAATPYESVPINLTYRVLG